MIYATVTDMLDYFGAREAIQLTGPLSATVSDEVLRAVADAADTSAFDQDEVAAAKQVDEYVNRAIEDAESIINTYLVGKYPLPIDPVPLRLRTACCDIARMQMHTDSVSEVVEKRDSSSMKWLKDVSEGYAKIGVNADDEAPPQRDIIIHAPARRFRAPDLEKKGFGL